ncbi:hypothetical protein [Alkaliphilus oremlandii]|uniref:Uncharacterized protein n=1 Tax=Alkaliphilus oremlandii (strain OhILAs) TaxID=350688 RepID=A8MGJ1_ALKOO|nr:hypothetical protein [Alkaliphilus oremlandii]ABW19214.1 hypothetical protein Clos_1674 [Alkaliphilus oremlandii OhILAs]
MQLTTTQQYLAQTHNNLFYVFSINKDQSLHYRIYKDHATVLETNILAQSILDFTVTMDQKDQIHMICVDLEGNLLYYIHQNDSWNSKTISKFDVKSNIYRYFMLFVQNGYTHIIYNKTNLLTPMLSSIEHIYWNQNGINKSIVANYIHGRYPSPHQIAMDRTKNLHLLYKVHHKTNHQIYYTKFNVLTKKWTTAELVTNLSEDNSHPYIFVDRMDNIHMAWCSIEQNNFILKYKYKPKTINGKSSWSHTQILSNRNSNTLSPIILQEDDLIKILCKQNNQIIEIYSKDFGCNWELKNDMLSSDNSTEIIKFFSNRKINDKFLMQDIYGSIDNTLKTIGIDLFFHLKEESTTVNLTEAPLQPLEGYEKDEDNSLEVLQHDLPQSQVTTEEEGANIENITLPHDMEHKIDSARYQTIINELLFNYETIEKQLTQIEEEKKRLTKTICSYESDLNLLEEKLVTYKKQMLTFQDKLTEATSHSSIFHKFLNFFK